MKKLNLILLLAILMLTADAQSLLTNPSFSNWTGYVDGTKTAPDEWTVFQRVDLATLFKSTDTPTGTGNSLQINMTGSRKVLETTQVILPPNGSTEFNPTKTYRLSIAVKQLSGSNNNAKIWCKWFASNGTTEITPYSDKYDGGANLQKQITAINDVWSTFTYNCVPPEGATKFHFAFLTLGASTLLWANPSFEELPSPTVTPIIGTYTYNGSAQGPNTSNVGGSTGTVTYSYTGTGGTTYGPSATLPTDAGTYTVTVHVAADANYSAGNSSATTFSIYSTGEVTAPSTNISSLTLSESSNITVSGSSTLVVNQNTTVNSVTVAVGGKLTINNGITLTSPVSLENSTDGSTATFVDYNTTPTQTQNILMKQYVTSGRNWYMSAPVSAADYSTLDKGVRVVEFNEGTKLWDNVTIGNLIAGKGYIQVANATEGLGNTGHVSFSGLANSGNVSVSLTRTESGSTRGFNLVGNPYPSYLDWSQVIADGENSAIGTTFWYRTKNTDDAYTFATHNGTSGETITGTATTAITKFIPPMQAFWVRVNENIGQTTYSTSMKFKNIMRSHRDETTNTMKAPKLNQRKLIRLIVSNGIASDDALIYFDANAQNSFDNYDSPKMFNNLPSQPEIYTQIGNEKLVINGMSELNDNVEIPLGFITREANNFTIKASQFSNFEVGTQVILKDYIDVNKPITTDLSDGSSYTFSSVANTNNAGRFTLRFKSPQVSTGVNSNSNENVWISTNANRQIMINGVIAGESTVTIYSALGQKITAEKLMQINNELGTRLPAGVYMITVNNAGKSITRKIILN